MYPIGENEKWAILVLKRTVFQEELPEMPYIRHQDAFGEKIKIHLADPIRIEPGKPTSCICGEEIPEEVIKRFNVIQESMK